MSNTYKDMPGWVRGWLLPTTDPRVSVHHDRDCLHHTVHGRWGQGATGVNRPCDLDGPVSRTGTPRAYTCQRWADHNPSRRYRCTCCNWDWRDQGRDTRSRTRDTLRAALRDYNAIGDYDALDAHDVAWG